jgi:hypothetical protein
MMVASPSVAAKVSTSCLFVYGTLMSPSVLVTLLDRVPVGRDAMLPHGFVRHAVRDHLFPAVIFSSSRTEPKKDVRVKGRLLQDLNPTEMKLLDWFEGDEYQRTPITVTLCDGEDEKQDGIIVDQVETQVYLWVNPLSELNLQGTWDFDAFEQEHVENYLTHTVRPCRDELIRDGLLVPKQS